VAIVAQLNNSARDFRLA